MVISIKLRLYSCDEEVVFWTRMQPLRQMSREIIRSSVGEKGKQVGDGVLEGSKEAVAAG